MPAFPTFLHSYESEAIPIENVAVELSESGQPMSYQTSEKTWYKVTLINKAYHDKSGVLAESIDAFYSANKTAENITFECKGYRYIGLMLKRPQAEQPVGFGLWHITTEFQAQRLGKSTTDTTESYLAYYLQQRGELNV